MESYDASTGQVFVETTAPVRSMVTAWGSAKSGKRVNPEAFTNQGTAASSLYDAALRSCIWNAELFTPEALQYYGWTFAERIYNQLKERDTFTVTAWSIFQAAFPEEVDRAYNINVPGRCGEATSLVHSFASRIQALPFQCTTFLCIRNLRLGTEHFMDIMKIPTLAALVLEQDPGYVYGKAYNDIDDRFMKQWAKAIVETGSFAKLKLLILRHFATGVESLKAMTCFPALFLCNIDSWYLKLNMQGIADEIRPFRHARWRLLPTGKQVDYTRDSNPQTIWHQKDITSHRKMDILHELATKYTDQALGTQSTRTPHLPRVSIDHGEGVSAMHHKTFSGWFARILPTVEELHKDAKRLREANGPPRGASEKRPKMRQTKQKDIGSLLGAFD